MVDKQIHFRLAEICQTLHSLLYVKKKRKKAAKYLPELSRLLDEIPVDDPSLRSREGRAIQAELEGWFRCAIAWRLQELGLILFLQAIVEAGQASPYVIEDMDDDVVAVREKIIKKLQSRMAKAAGG